MGRIKNGGKKKREIEEPNAQILKPRRRFWGCLVFLPIRIENWTTQIKRDGNLCCTNSQDWERGDGEEQLRKEGPCKIGLFCRNDLQNWLILRK